MLIDEIIPFELPSNFEVIDALPELIYESSLDTAALFYCAGVGVGMSSHHGVGLLILNLDMKQLRDLRRESPLNCTSTWNNKFGLILSYWASTVVRLPMHQ